MLLQESWVERIFSRLAARYGTRFTNRYEGVDPKLVKQDWAEVLGGFHDFPDALSYALANLPVHEPPTAAEFRDIARQCKRPAPMQLPAPLDPEAKQKAAEASAQVKQFASRLDAEKPGYDFLRWARNPKGYAAANAIAELIDKRDPRFVEIGRELVAQGHAFAAPIKAALDRRVA